MRRIVDFAVSRGKRSFAALLPDNAYGTVVEAAFQQEVSRRGGRVVALEKYPIDTNRMAEAARRVAQAANQVDSIFIPDGADAVPQVVQALTAGGVNLKRVQLLGTGLWDDPRIFSTTALDGGWYAAPESAGFRNFSARYRARYGQDPVRTATLAYDATALVAALVKTQGTQRFSEQVLTNASGFAGIDGVFRFLPQGTNERGLGGVARDADRRAGDQSRAEVVPVRDLNSGREVGDHRIEERKTTLRHTQAAVRRRLDRAFLAQYRNALGIEHASGQRGVACGIDAFGKPQAHQQILVADFAGCQFFIHGHAIAVCFHAHQPGFRTLVGFGRDAATLDREPAMRARVRYRHSRARANRRDCAGIPRPAARGWKFRRQEARISRKFPA